MHRQAGQSEMLAPSIDKHNKKTKGIILGAGAALVAAVAIKLGSGGDGQPTPTYTPDAKGKITIGTYGGSTLPTGETTNKPTGPEALPAIGEFDAKTALFPGVDDEPAVQGTLAFADSIAIKKHGYNSREQATVELPTPLGDGMDRALLAAYSGLKLNPGLKSPEARNDYTGAVRDAARKAFFDPQAQDSAMAKYLDSRIQGVADAASKGAVADVTTDIVTDSTSFDDRVLVGNTLTQQIGFDILMDNGKRHFATVLRYEQRSDGSYGWRFVKADLVQ